MTKIDFSVLMSVYEKENPEYLNLALNSIWMDQTVRPTEIVIVKDGVLPDDLESILFDFAQKAPVKFVVNENNMGLSASLNKGLMFCDNDLVARMDSDDISSLNRFETQINYITANKNVDIVGSWAQKIDNNGNEIGLLKVPLLDKDIKKLIWTCPFIHPTIIFNKKKLLSIGSYNPKSGPRQDDYELWFRCAANNFVFANIDQTLLYYRFSSDNIKKNSINVGWHRFKVGFNGCRKLNCSLIAYLGITVPLLRSLLPHPLDIYIYHLLNKINPRNR